MNPLELGYSKEYLQAFRLYRRVFASNNREAFERYAEQNGGIDNLAKVCSSLLLVAALG